MQNHYPRGIGAKKGKLYGTLYSSAVLLSQIGFNVPQGVEVSMTDHPDKVNQC